ncbi:Ig-like domain-containing protein [Gemmatimonas aurantiaca]|uniref:Ig-like domain-containing protein n=1 Tax=Gemmatimonas aurantiaca TaxID=173480 RepID=UPI00301DE14F
MKTKLVGISLLAAIAAVPTAHAQGLGERIEVGVFGQYTKLDADLRMKRDVFGGGGRIGMSIYKWLGVEGDINLGKTEATRNPFEKITYRPFRALGTLTVPVTSSKKTSLILGVGYLNSVFANRATANEYEDGFATQLGVKICGSGKWGTRIDGLWDFNPSPNEQPLDGTSSNGSLRVGVTYALRGACAGEGETFDWALRIDPASATVNRGTDRQFALSAADAKSRPIELRNVQNLTCSSSDASVATVDNTGKVTAVKAGTATITCRGTVKKLDRTASSTVTVPAPDWNLTLSPSSGSTDVGKTLSFTSRAVDADNADLGAVTWSSANPSIASVNNGTVTCNAAGTTTITVSKTAYGTTKTQQATVECKALPAARVAFDTTLFSFDKAVVLKAGNDTLKVIVDVMKRNPNIRISIEGHTDWYGSESYNNKLAKSRAEAVYNQLMKVAGADAASLRGRVVWSSFGEQCILVRNGDTEQEPPPARRPRVSAANRQAQAANRRVEIWQLLDGQGAPTSCRSEGERAGRRSFGDLK